MGEKTEQWAFQRIRELEQQLKAARERAAYQRWRAENWKQRALRKTLKR